MRNLNREDLINILYGAAILGTGGGAADKPQVVAALKAMTEEGKYPDGLWK